MTTKKKLRRLQRIKVRKVRDIEEIIALYLKGSTVQEIAEHYGVTSSVIYLDLRKEKFRLSSTNGRVISHLKSDNINNI